MKSKKSSIGLLIVLLVFGVLYANAQVPETFSYQVMVRDGSNNPIANRAVKFRISLQNDNGTSVYFTETHSATTTSLGLINLNIGGGAIVTGTIKAVPWKTGSIYIKIEIDPNGGTAYTLMGTSKLQAVPFALYSTTSGEIVSEATALDDAPIFVVRNKAGKIVFAVYQTGVRAYVEDAKGEKGARGGFAVGGLTNQGKAETEYFRITNDSARIWVNSSAAKGARGGFAVGGLNNKATSSNFLVLTPENYFIGHESGINTTTGINNSFLGYHAGHFNTEGYQNVFLGRKSGYSNMTGYNNIFIGDSTGSNNTEGYNNVFIGSRSGIANLDGIYNVFLGHLAGAKNTSGQSNIIIGDEAGESNTTGYFNVMIGDYCGASNTTGSSNIFLGANSGWSNTIGLSNIFLGANSGWSNTIGNENTFIGTESGYNNTEGLDNVFLGNNSGYSNTTGLANVFLGKNSGYSNLTGTNNIFLGSSAGYTNSSGGDNTFIGTQSGYGNTEGVDNVFLGNQSGYSNTTGLSNVFLGKNAGYNNLTGAYNIFLGRKSGYSNSSGNKNIFIGDSTGSSNTEGFNNVFIGSRSGVSNLDGYFNIFLGHMSGAMNTSGQSNIIMGDQAGESNTTGNSNVMIGDWSGRSNTIGISNVFLGANSGWSNAKGNYNTFIGTNAGNSNIEGSKNVFIGNEAGSNESGSNKLYIANTNTSSPLVYGEFDNNKLVVNGSVNVKELFNLKPQTTSPGNPVEGDVFYDANSHSIKYFNGTVWMAIGATASSSTPFVSTVSVPYVEAASCNVNCNISSQGSSAIIQSGIRYSNTPFFDILSGIAINYSTPGVGNYVVTITGLNESTTYYVRSFATNSQGTSLGNMITFTTSLITDLPTVTTNQVSSITQTSAVCGGNVIAPGGSLVTARGICWSTSSNPTIDNSFTSNGSGSGTFSSNLSGLTANTTYYVRAYATNANGTAYGNELFFYASTVTDIVGNVYNTIKIGTQIWMKENLKTTKYRNNVAITNITDNTAWSTQTSGAYCWFNNDINNKTTYGALYNYYAVIDSRNLCPTGWHVPSDAEWTTLTDYLGGVSVAGAKLKEAGFIHWASPNTGADNSSGFTAVPGGYRESSNGAFVNIGAWGDWWTSTSDATGAFDRGLGSSSSSVTQGSYSKADGYSVRCIKD